MTMTKALRRNPAPDADKRGTDLARRAEIGEMKRARTRAGILQAAIRVLGHEQGRLMTVDNVFSEAGVSRGTFYNHFDGRDQLLREVAYELMHDFDAAVRSALESEASVTVRTAYWPRHYMHRVRSDPRWGWALVNVSLIGPQLFAEETQRQARLNLEEGVAAKEFKVDSVEAVLDLGWGSLLAASVTMLRGQAPPDHPEQVALLHLRALGVPEAKARRAIAAPLHVLGLVSAGGVASSERTEQVATVHRDY
jgi:AcrR family transcriptional regulator